MIAAEPPTTAAARPRVDLRGGEYLDVVATVEQAFGVRFALHDAVIKRRSIGAPTDRGTWVRIEARAFDRLHGQTADGVEAAAMVEGVAKPAWYRGTSWADPDRGVMWRADETEKVTAVPVSSGGALINEPFLPDSWWRGLVRSLDALTAARPRRTGFVHTAPITQGRFSTTIESAFGNAADTTITAWGGVHGDLAWTNLTAPELFILDWEDFGNGPIGLDHASLWAASLAVPTLTKRIESEFTDVFGTRTGRLCQVFFLAELLSAPADYAGPLRAPAEAAAEVLVSSLR